MNLPPTNTRSPIAAAQSRSPSVPQFTAVTRDRHADKAWRRHTSYAFAGGDAVLPLVAFELTHAVMTLPVAFVKQYGRYVLMAVLSLTPGRNLFVAPDGRWLGGYVPAVLRGYPFRLLRPEGSAESVLCVDEQSGLVVEAGQGEAFLTPEGVLGDGLTQVLDFLGQIERNRAATEAAVAALAEADVIEPWPLTQGNGGATVPVIGLHRISEDRFNALDDETLLTLRRAGALPIVYLQMLSMQQTTVLKRLADLQEELARVEATKAKMLDGTFGILSDQEFRLVF